MGYFGYCLIIMITAFVFTTALFVRPLARECLSNVIRKIVILIEALHIVINAKIAVAIYDLWQGLFLVGLKRSWFSTFLAHLNTITIPK